MKPPSLEWYLARCAEFGIERVEPGTYEVIAIPCPLFTESGPDSRSQSRDRGALPSRHTSSSPLARADQSAKRELF